MHFYLPQMQTEPSGFNTGTIGAAQCENCTGLMTPVFSSWLSLFSLYCKSYWSWLAKMRMGSRIFLLCCLSCISTHLWIWPHCCQKQLAKMRVGLLVHYAIYANKGVISPSSLVSGDLGHCQHPRAEAFRLPYETYTVSEPSKMQLWWRFFSQALCFRSQYTCCS